MKDVQIGCITQQVEAQIELHEIPQITESRGNATSKPRAGDTIKGPDAGQ